MVERNDALWLAIFKYGESATVEVGHDVLFVILHGGVKTSSTCF